MLFRSHRFLEENGISSTRVYWPSEEDMEPQALTMLHERKIDMVVNIPRDLSAGELNNGYKIRRAAIDLNIPLITNARLASAFIEAFCTLGMDDNGINPPEIFSYTFLARIRFFHCAFIPRLQIRTNPAMIAMNPACGRLKNIFFKQTESAKPSDKDPLGTIRKIIF